MNAVQFEEFTEYWSDTARKDKLYTAILLNDAAGFKRLKAQGVGLSDHIKGMLGSGGGSLAKPNEYGEDWYSFCNELTEYSPEEFIWVISCLRAELDEPIYFSDTVYWGYPKLYRTEVFKCVLKCFDNRRMPKKRMLTHIIDHDMTEQLKLTAEHGWLKLAKKCDEYIEYAHKCDSVECAAFLLDYKNKNFDAAKEREKAEKRQNAELNAAPDSVMMMKKLWTYKKLEDGTIAIKRYKGDRTEIVVPEKIGKDTVTELKVDVYYEGAPRKSFVSDEIKMDVTKVTLPNGLLSIGGAVFCEFAELREINIPNGVLSIGAHAFYDCGKIKTMTLPESVKEIGFGAFRRCFELEEINVPQGITKIDDYVFEACEKLKAVGIPEGIQSIGKGAFYNCKSIESVIIPSGITEISEDSFGSCEKLSRVELPDTIVKINSYAFAGCSSLKEIAIPEGVREIGYVAFGHCAALERIVLPASLEKAKNYTQKGIEPRTIFYNSPNVTAVVTPGSYAEKYCKRNNIPFVYDEN